MVTSSWPVFALLSHGLSVTKDPLCRLEELIHVKSVEALTLVWCGSLERQKCEVDLSNGSCSPGICHGSSQCTNKNSAIVCKNCSFEAWSTEICQLKTRNFDRGTYLTFPALRQRHRLSISIKFATQERHALLLYNGRYNDEHDFISLEIINAQLVFSFSLGGQVSQVPTFVAGGVSDGQWHTAEVNYFNRRGRISHMLEYGWSARQVFRQVDLSNLTVWRHWDQRAEENIIYTVTRLRTLSTDQSLRRPSHHSTRTRRANCLIGHFPDTRSTFTSGPCVFPNHSKASSVRVWRSRGERHIPAFALQ
ncbi:cadherin EGF LAG seven-pass G-type receptor 2 [Trichonephila clavipes]|nr:cadherin EGF LAG seven-pass G-type receptor 2 [Trichonephila clavipes]